MRRKLFTGVSLVVCLGAVGLWVRSFLVTDLVQVRIVGAEVSLFSESGAIQVRLVVYTSGGGNRFTYRRFGFSASDDLQMIAMIIEDLPLQFDTTPGGHWAVRAKYDEGKFDGFSGSLAPDFRYVLVVVPYWIVVGIGVLALVLALLRRARFVDGRCRRCFYDLTGNVSGCAPSVARWWRGRWRDNGEVVHGRIG